MKIFGYFTFLIATIISSVAAYYSIVGLTAIFAAAVLPIVIMGVALEVGKVTAAMWLKVNWHRAGFTYKLYLVPAVAFLMLLTSMGIFGFLSKAHSDQSMVSGDVVAKIAIYDEKIKNERDNIDNARSLIKQMDDAVNGIQANGTEREIKLKDGRTYTRSAAELALQTRRSQAKDRERLSTEIAQAQEKIVALQEERAPIAAEVRKVEAEVGPVKYIAALVYGDNPDTNVLEKAVRWVIILIVAVFDPLALVLMLAAQQTLRWVKDDEQPAPAYPPDDGPLTPEQYEQVKESVGFVAQEIQAVVPEAVVSEHKPAQHHPDTHPYLKAGFAGFPNDLKPMVAPAEQTVQEPVEPEPVVEEKANEVFVSDDTGSYFLNTLTGERTYPVNPEQVRINQQYKKSEQQRTRADIERVVNKMKEQGIWPNPPESSTKFDIKDAIEADTSGKLEELLAKADDDTLQTVYKAIISDINKSKK